MLTITSLSIVINLSYIKASNNAKATKHLSFIIILNH